MKNKMKKGIKVKVFYEDDGKYKEFSGKIIYIFKAYKIPKKKKVLKYYGKKVAVPQYGNLFGPMKYDRLVVKKKNNNYTVLPVQGINKYFSIRKI